MMRLRKDERAYYDTISNFIMIMIFLIIFIAVIFPIMTNTFDVMYKPEENRTEVIEPIVLPTGNQTENNTTNVTIDKPADVDKDTYLSEQENPHDLSVG